MTPDQASSGNENKKYTVWKLFIPINNFYLKDQLKNWANLLSFKSNELNKLKDNGWTTELDCLIQVLEL